jgi:hypothetical protein
MAKKFNVWNMTDGVMVNHRPLSSAEADVQISAFPDRYKQQGYYSTNSGERIDPKDVNLVKMPLGQYPDLANCDSNKKIKEMIKSETDEHPQH